MRLTVRQLTGKGDVEEAALLPWLRLHSGPVTGLSVRADARRLLSVGLDGKVFVVPTDTEVGNLGLSPTSCESFVIFTRFWVTLPTEDLTRADKSLSF
jgi:hypothetical protein